MAQIPFYLTLTYLLVFASSLYLIVLSKELVKLAFRKEPTAHGAEMKFIKGKAEFITHVVTSYQITKREGNKGLGVKNRVFPQNITLYLRPGRPATVNVKVKTPTNYPVDLYYLMDLSFSMLDDKQRIVNISNLLERKMKEVTSNFRLGFGAFVDKNLGPYTFTRKEEISKKLAEHPESQMTFGFKNYLPLDVDPKKFETVVRECNISFNIDAPEGSLDAMMQVVACEKSIGWRAKKEARRIVILTTDAGFHFAGDGLLGGVVSPNDGQCHLSQSGNYIKSNQMDYPSLSFLREKMLGAEIVPIFATTGNLKLYKRVEAFFGNASGAVAAALNNDSSNIVPLIRSAYEKISRTVKVSTEKVSGLNVKFQAKCGNKRPWADKDGCTEIDLGEEVQFNVTVEATACSKSLKNVQSFGIKTSFDDVNVNLKLVCDCECDDPLYDVKSANICNSRGTLKCGKCVCDPTYTGRFCQCTEMMNEDKSKCRIGGTGSVCSGRGTCECAECVRCKKTKNPFEYIYGAFCECSNATCPKSFGEICGGNTRGICDCNKCKCEPDWTGPACGQECINSTAGCLSNNKICSDRGSCVCGKCTGCSAGYFGDYCEQCAENCPDPCAENSECVKCKVFGTSDLSATACEAECTKRKVRKVTIVNYVEAGAGERCTDTDKNDCSFIFTSKKINNTDYIELLVQKERICPGEPNILAIILGVIAGIVGVGLVLLLIWKLLATLKDRRELAKFNKDLQELKFDTDWHFVTRFCYRDSLGSIDYRFEYPKSMCCVKAILYYDSQWGSVYPQPAMSCAAKLNHTIKGNNQILNLDFSQCHQETIDGIKKLVCTGSREFISKRSRWWYLVFSNCGSVKGLQVKYNVVMTNGDWFWVKHFSADEQRILEPNIYFLAQSLFFFALSLVLAAVLKSRQLFHYTFKLFIWSFAFEVLSLIFDVAYYTDYGKTGRPKRALKIFERGFHSIADVIFLLLLVLLAKGWTVTRGRISSSGQVKLGVFFTLYVIIYIAMYIYEAKAFDPGKVLYLYESPAGYGLCGMRVLAWIWFSYGTFFTLKHYPMKYLFYYPYWLFYTLWFLSGPILVLIAAFVLDPWIRAQVMNGIDRAVAFGAYAFFMILTAPCSANQNFPYHVRTTQVGIVTSDSMDNFTQHAYAPSNGSFDVNGKEFSNITAMFTASANPAVTLNTGRVINHPHPSSNALLTNGTSGSTPSSTPSSTPPEYPQPSAPNLNMFQASNA
eukprot:gene11259-12439_t